MNQSNSIIKKLAVNINTEGQPDKLADRIADALLDAFIKENQEIRTDINVALTKEKVFISGEISEPIKLRLDDIIVKTIIEAGYTDRETGIDPYKIQIINNLQSQSREIIKWIMASDDKGIGASDQGTVYGYATNESSEYLPTPYIVGKKIAERLKFVRDSEIIDSLLPDGNIQIVMEYESDKPIRIDTLMLNVQHKIDADTDWLKMEINQKVLDYSCKNWVDPATKIIINPGGKFTIGGPTADAGNSGHLVENETMGGVIKYGGLSFAGKDPSKINRTVALYLRKIAKDVVQKRLANRCELSATYAFGVAEPIALEIDTFGTATVDEYEILSQIKRIYSLRVSDILKQMDVYAFIYKNYDYTMI